MPQPFEYLSFPRNQSLTTLARFKEETGSTATDDLLNRLISRASDEIETLLGRRLARAQATDRFKGVNLRDQVLALPPLVEIVAVRNDGDAQDLTEIEAVGGGVIFNPAGFLSTLRPLWEVDYWGGYLLKTDDVLAVTTISALSADNSFNITGATWPFVRAGDWINVSGFATETVLNTFHKVASRTDTKIIVETAIASDDLNVSPAVAITVEVANLPEVLERACVLLAHAGLDVTSTSVGAGTVKVAEKAGDLMVQYEQISDGKTDPLREMLKPYARMI